MLGHRFLCLVVAMLLALTGCRHFCKQCQPQCGTNSGSTINVPPGSIPVPGGTQPFYAPPPTGVAPSAVAPATGFVAPPSTGSTVVPAAPAPSPAPLPPQPDVLLPEQLPPGFGGSSQSRSSPPVPLKPQRVAKRSRIDFGMPVPDTQYRNGRVLFMAPEPLSPTSWSAAKPHQPPRLSPLQSPLAPPPRSRQPATHPPVAGQFLEFPVGIPAFAQVKSRVFTGLRPDLDGLAWLRDQSFATAVYLHAPETDISSDRKMVEEHAMAFHAIAIAPDRIRLADLQRFTALVDATSGGPVFVYDETGVYAGCLWYAYFRMVDGSEPDAARDRAERFGLKAQGNNLQIQLWTAIQHFLDAR